MTADCFVKGTNPAEDGGASRIVEVSAEDGNVSRITGVAEDGGVSR
jgi:hypothetical protein